MSNFGIRQNSPQHQEGANSATGNEMEDFHYFILNEMSRRKRTAGSDHVVIDSPTRKRSRLL